MIPKASVVPVDDYIRKKATLHVARRKEEVFEGNLMYDLIGAAIETKKSDDNVWDCLKRVDLTRIIKDSPGLNKQFTCPIFADRKAWVFKSKNGHYRYYTRKKTSIYSFDLIDLLGVYRNETRKAVLTFVQNQWNLKGLTDWYIEQNEMYQLNEYILCDIRKNIEEYPYLNKLIGKHWPVLKKLNEFAREKLTGKELAVNGKAIFFLSNNYFMEKYFPNYSNSTINNLINLYCILGFVKKVPLKEIPKELSTKAMIEYKLKKVRNHVSYFQIIDFQDVCEEAEKRARILVEADIYYHRLTRTVVQSLFGESFANKIYVQQTYGKKAKLEPIYVKNESTFYTETEKLEKLFLREINDTGKCAKSTLYQSSLLPYLRFNTAWKNLIQKYHCEEKYPTLREMKEYQMNKRLLIAVPNKKECSDRFR